MTVAEWIVEFLARQGVSHVFELSGGMITPLLNACARSDTAPILVDCRHEQGAGFAAEGWARMTGIPGVAMATSGPGATNLLTAIGSCYFDSTPCVFITGQVPTRDLRRGRGVRQWGFQELDIGALARPILKSAWRVEHAKDVCGALRTAFEHALEDRQGPVLIDLPLDVQRAEMPEGDLSCVLAPDLPKPSAVAIDLVGDALGNSERPLILVGGGCARYPEIAPALAALGVPVVTSLMGRDAYPAAIGMIGTYGNRWANKALVACDTLIVIGSRLDVRQTGADTAKLAAGKAIIQVDLDAHETDRLPLRGAILAGAAEFCTALAARGENFHREPWIEEIAGWAAESPSVAENAGCAGINPNEFMHVLGEAATSDVAAFVVDVGAHQMWAAQSLQLRPGQRWLTSGGMGAMGFALPAAIGACLAAHRRPVVAIMGDGGAQINAQELQTIRDLNLPIKIVVVNNAGHGMVRQFQRELFGGRFAGTAPRAANFIALAGAYRIDAERIVSAGEVYSAIRWLLTSLSPALLEVMIDPGVEVRPKARFGKELDEMD
jgi:acetolactate synthase-1/2/3 large subunit